MTHPVLQTCATCAAAIGKELLHSRLGHQICSAARLRGRYGAITRCDPARGSTAKGWQVIDGMSGEIGFASEHKLPCTSWTAHAVALHCARGSPKGPAYPPLVYSFDSICVTLYAEYQTCHGDLSAVPLRAPGTPGGAVGADALAVVRVVVIAETRSRTFV